MAIFKTWQRELRCIGIGLIFFVVGLCASASLAATEVETLLRGFLEPQQNLISATAPLTDQLVESNVFGDTVETGVADFGFLSATSRSTSDGDTISGLATATFRDDFNVVPDDAGLIGQVGFIVMQVRVQGVLSIKWRGCQVSTRPTDSRAFRRV